MVARWVADRLCFQPLGQYEIWTMNADGTSLKQITNGLGNCIKLPGRRMKEHRVCFGQNGIGGYLFSGNRFWHTMRLTETASAETDPAWSRVRHNAVLCFRPGIGMGNFCMKLETHNTRA
jgi:hypothetical protein